MSFYNILTYVVSDDSKRMCFVGKMETCSHQMFEFQSLLCDLQQHKVQECDYKGVFSLMLGSVHNVISQSDTSSCSAQCWFDVTAEDNVRRGCTVRASETTRISVSQS